MSQSHRCGDCGCEEGQFHGLACDLEYCQICGQQYLSCDCNRDAKKAARKPYIYYPQLCARCGAFWPDFFTVSQEDWLHYIELNMRDEIICLACYHEIKQMIDTAEGIIAASDSDNPDRLIKTPEQFREQFRAELAVFHKEDRREETENPTVAREDFDLPF